MGLSENISSIETCSICTLKVTTICAFTDNEGIRMRQRCNAILAEKNIQPYEIFDSQHYENTASTVIEGITSFQPFVFQGLDKSYVDMARTSR